MQLPDVGPQPKERWWEYLRRMWRSYDPIHRVIYGLHLKRRPTLEEVEAEIRERFEKDFSR